MAKIYETLAQLVADVTQDSQEVACRVAYRGKDYLVLAEDETEAAATVFFSMSAEAGLVPMAELIAAARMPVEKTEAKPETPEKPEASEPAEKPEAGGAAQKKTAASKTGDQSNKPAKKGTKKTTSAK